ncbi:trace amine-associated receptor 1 [Nematostella vectensis]|uniref:trace amine-associated receptor 1 n=1 Tax=Nematostella vectensis TaxID=45351 RepID=UPI00207736BC|nr:trace amine-associated receptor 1 [Nematostella vectensis]XP_048581389.1 trace amine-associated receptor 1 [Nematostella vectensis]
MANESGITRESSDYNKTGWIVAFTAVAVATIVGNSLTLAVFHRTKMFHRRSSYLLINLTVADGLVGVLSIPLFIYILCVRDVGSVLSNVYTFQDIFLGLTSVTSLMFISAERFYAVRYPLKYRSLSTRPHVIMILLSWTFAGFIASARILTTLGLLDTMTLTYLMVCSITVPLFLTCLFYTAVWVTNKARHFQGRMMHQENKLSLTLFIITSVFIISWTPFPVANIVVTFWPAIPGFSGFITFLNVAKLLHYGNSLSNPIIYTMKMTEFRKSLIQLVFKQGSYYKPQSKRLTAMSRLYTMSGEKKRKASGVLV